MPDDLIRAFNKGKPIKLDINGSIVYFLTTPSPDKNNMGGGMTTLEIKAGERKRIIRKFSSSIVATYKFSAEPVNPSEDISGTVEIKGSNWLFPKPAETQELQQQNSVEKGMWDTFYSVFVTPDVDVNISMPKSGIGYLWIYIAIAVFITIFAAGLVIITMS